jgi:hypothetical protein
MMTSNDSSAALPKTPSIIVFRDKLLLPSEGFIKTHYTAFDAANLVYVASHFGWRAAELDGQMMATAPDSLRRFWFKKTGRTCILRWHRGLFMHILGGVGRWRCRWQRRWGCRFL